MKLIGGRVYGPSFKSPSGEYLTVATIGGSLLEAAIEALLVWKDEDELRGVVWPSNRGQKEISI